MARSKSRSAMLITRFRFIGVASNFIYLLRILEAFWLYRLFAWVSVQYGSCIWLNMLISVSLDGTLVPSCRNERRGGAEPGIEGWC
jgi:hypothetical protein